MLDIFDVFLLKKKTKKNLRHTTSYIYYNVSIFKSRYWNPVCVITITQYYSNTVTDSRSLSHSVPLLSWLRSKIDDHLHFLVLALSSIMSRYDDLAMSRSCRPSLLTPWSSTWWPWCGQISSPCISSKRCLTARWW